MSNVEPLVTVMIITYNHARYIGDAIESVLNQKTDFPFNIHVIEDCSTDGTQEILKSYEQRFPDKVKLFLNEKNIGYKVTQKNFIRGFKTLKAKYISILEGDDLWCYDGKLQKQVDFLETHPDFVAHAHNTIKFYNGHELPSHRFLYNENIKQDHDVHDFIKIQSFFHTTTLLYRNVLKDRVPKQFVNPYSCDIFNAIAHVQYGKVRYVDEDWARYRVHPQGRFSGMTPVTGWFFNIDGLRRYNAWLKYRYCKTFSEAILKYCKYVLSVRRAGSCKLTFQQAIKLYYLLWIYSIAYTFLRILTFPFKLKNAMKARKDGVDLNNFNFKLIDDLRFIQEV